MKLSEVDRTNGKMHAEEWDVVLWRYPVAWGRPGEVAHSEYRWHCIGHRSRGWWSLHTAMANRREPVGRSAELVRALREGLERVVGVPVRQFGASMILWAEEDALPYQPCPYRHGASRGYAPVQLALLKASAWGA